MSTLPVTGRTVHSITPGIEGGVANATVPEPGRRASPGGEAEGDRGGDGRSPRSSGSCRTARSESGRRAARRSRRTSQPTAVAASGGKLPAEDCREAFEKFRQ